MLNKGHKFRTDAKIGSWDAIILFEILYIKIYIKHPRNRYKNVLHFITVKLFHIPSFMLMKYHKNPGHKPFDVATL